MKEINDYWNIIFELLKGLDWNKSRPSDNEMVILAHASMQSLPGLDYQESLANYLREVDVSFIWVQKSLIDSSCKALIPFFLPPEVEAIIGILTSSSLNRMKDSSRLEDIPGEAAISSWELIVSATERKNVTHMIGYGVSILRMLLLKKMFKAANRFNSE